MKFNITIVLIFLLFTSPLLAQDIIPRAKTKAEKKAERKNMTLEEKIESTLPVDITLPKASAKLPGNNQISSVEDARKFVKETLPGYGTKAKEKAKKTKKQIADAKEKIFDGKSYKGIALEKHIYKRGTGSRMTYIEFYTLKEHQQPNPYNRTFFWLDEKSGKIVEAVARDSKTNHLLHGPYKEYKGENLVKEGYFFVGTKDGRWEEYDQEFTLLDKMYYRKGFPEESIISYYDNDSAKIKEVVPVVFGSQSGIYYRFHEEGTLAEEGQLDGGKKIGRWVEYYENGNRRKKEIQYPTDRYDTKEPLVVREYSADGKMTFEHESVRRN